jgi:integrase/recombinase XerD
MILRPLRDFMPKEGKSRVLSEAEFKRLLIIAKEGPFGLRNVAIVYCSFGLGLRVKEISSLKIADVFDSQFKVLDEINLKRRMTKGEKQRHVYITNQKLANALQLHLNDMRAKEKEQFNKESWLFKTQRRSRFHPDVLQKWFRKLYDKTGLIGASSHSGRRTFITRLIEQGADIKAVSRLAGHANIVTTSEYVEDNPDRLKRISSLALF